MMKILVGYVNNALGRAALDSAVEQAKLRSGELVLFRHIRYTDEREHTGDAATEAQAELDGVAERLSKDGIAASGYTSIGLRSAGSEILEFAGKNAVDLIVVGLRRRSPVGKAVLGSDAQEVLLGADCQVLAVKADDK